MKKWFKPEIRRREVHSSKDFRGKWGLKEVGIGIIILLVLWAVLKIVGVF